MIKAISLIFTMLFLLSSSYVNAEVKTFIKEYTYQASEFDSKAKCRTLALEQVKRLLLEELGTYLESETEVKNFQLTKDQITSLTAGVVQTQVLLEKWDGDKYWLKASMKADPDEVAKNINNLSKDRRLRKDLENSRKIAAVALAEVKNIKQEIQKVKSDEQLKRYNDAIQRLNATDLYERGIRYLNIKKYNEAAEAFTDAIKVNPNYYEAYVLRGINYGNKGNHDLAIKDFVKAITINPHDPDAYLGRGLAYVYTYKYDLAIMDFSKVIEIDPDYYDGYRYRGDIYFYKKDYDRAIDDFSKAVEINPAAIMAVYNF